MGSSVTTAPADRLATIDPTAWARQGDISARSALVTVFGDTMIGLDGDLWLSDVFTLVEPFGFSERLLRTSLSRLAATDWVTSERHGRRSRYRLTPFARQESIEAGWRIYQVAAAPTSDADAPWTILFSEDEILITELRWRGFAEIAPGTLGRPGTDVEAISSLVERLGVSEPAIATAHFTDTSRLARHEHLRQANGLGRAQEAYGRFVDHYRPLAGRARPADGRDAFALRTMVIHDLRRCRLAQPDVPAAILGPDWVGHTAHGLAAEIYRAVTTEAWEWVARTTGLGIDPDIDRDRFVEPAAPSDTPVLKPAQT